MIKSLYEWIAQRSRLQTLIVFSGLLGLVVTYIYPNAFTLVIPPALILGVAIAELPSGEKLAFRPPNWAGRALAIFLLGGFSVLTLLYLDANYQRTLGIHVVTAILYGGAALLAFLRPVTAVAAGIAIAIHQRAMIYYSSASQFGLDALFHQQMAAEISEVGTIDPLFLANSKYYFAPLYHILVATAMDLGGLPVRTAAFLTSTVIVTVAPALVIFLLTRRYWNARAGALAAILYVASDWAIDFAVRPRTLSLGFSFFPFILLGLLLYYERIDRRYAWLTVALFVAVVLIHQSTSFTILTCIGVISGVYYASGRLNAKQAGLIPGVCSLLLVASWSVTRTDLEGEQISFLGNLIRIALLEFTASGDRNTIFPQSEHYVVAGARALDPIHLVALGAILAMAVGGVLYILRRERDQQRVPITLLILVGTLAAIPVTGPIVGVTLLQPHRWFLFMYVPALVLVGIYLSSVDVFASRNRVLPLVVVALVVVSFSVAAGGNYRGAPDGSLFDSPGATKYTVEPSEKAAMEFVTTHQRDVVLADFVIMHLINRHFGGEADIYRYPRYGDPVPHETPFLAAYRPYANTHRAGFRINLENGGSETVLGKIPEPEGSQIYDSGGMWIMYVSNEAEKSGRD